MRSTLSTTHIALLTILILSFLAPHEVVAQKELSKREDHHKHYSQFTDDPKNEGLVTKFWTDVYREDIFESGIVTGEDIFPLYFDGLGSLYPSFELIAASELDLTPKGQRAPWYKNLWTRLAMGNRREVLPKGQHMQFGTTQSLCFITNRSNNYERLQFSQTAALAVEETKILKAAADAAIAQIGRNSFQGDMEKLKAYHAKRAFDSIWGDWISERTARQLADTLRGGNYDKVMFYIPGYCIPYAMQAVHAAKMRDSLRVEDPGSKWLVVSVFWPSGGTNKNQKVWTKNYGVSAGAQWFYFLNKAYYVGYGMRRFLNDLTPGVDTNSINFYTFAHSGGNAILTTMISDAVAYAGKKKPQRCAYRQCRGTTQGTYYNSDGTYRGSPCLSDSAFISSLIGDSVKEPTATGRYYTYDWLQMTGQPKYARSSIPMNYFLSAAAIGPMWAAEDVRIGSGEIYGSLNSEDPQLSKKYPLIKLTKLIKPRTFGTTTMGQDEDLGAKEAKKYLPHYRYTCDLDFKSHHVFRYLIEPEYAKLFREFIDADVTVSSN